MHTTRSKLRANKYRKYLIFAQPAQGGGPERVLAMKGGHLADHPESAGGDDDDDVR